MPEKYFFSPQFFSSKMQKKWEKNHSALTVTTTENIHIFSTWNLLMPFMAEVHLYDVAAP